MISFNLSIDNIKKLSIFFLIILSIIAVGFSIEITYNYHHTNFDQDKYSLDICQIDQYKLVDWTKKKCFFQLDLSFNNMTDTVDYTVKSTTCDSVEIPDYLECWTYETTALLDKPNDRDKARKDVYLWIPTSFIILCTVYYIREYIIELNYRLKCYTVVDPTELGVGWI
jgi:hypothetical protein